MFLQALVGAGAATGSVAGDGEVEEPRGFAQLESGQDGLLSGSSGRALRDLAVRGAQGGQVHAVEFVADGAPGVAGGVLGELCAVMESVWGALQLELLDTNTWPTRDEPGMNLPRQYWSG